MINRFDLDTEQYGPNVGVVKSADGDYVLYKDMMRLIKKCYIPLCEVCNKENCNIIDEVWDGYYEKEIVLRSSDDA